MTNMGVYMKKHQSITQKKSLIRNACLTAACTLFAFAGQSYASGLINLPAYPTLSHHHHSTAKTQQKDTITVYFLNGIFNSEVKTQSDAVALFLRLKDNPTFNTLVENNQVNLKTLYNPTDIGFGDTNELFAQADIQKKALKATQIRIEQEQLAQKYDAADLEKVRQAIFQQEIFKANQTYRAEQYSQADFIHTAGNRAIDHYRMLAEKVKESLLNGEKVVIVAHSQGNYVVQGIYAQLLHDSSVRHDVSQNLYVVGVANVAATTPTGSYITNSDDAAVYTLHKMQGGQPMPANFTPIFSNGEKLSGLSYAQRQNDPANHGFVQTYLSANFNHEHQFVPHNPEIIEKSTLNQPVHTSIYQQVVDKIMTGIALITK